MLGASDPMDRCVAETCVQMNADRIGIVRLSIIVQIGHGRWSDAVAEEPGSEGLLSIYCGAVKRCAPVGYVLTTLTYDAYFDGAAAVAGAGLNGKRLLAVFGRSAEREWLKLPVPCEWSA